MPEFHCHLIPTPQVPIPIDFLLDSLFHHNPQFKSVAVLVNSLNWFNASATRICSVHVTLVLLSLPFFINMVEGKG